jgi:hypothetical protein
MQLTVSIVSPVIFIVDSAVADAVVIVVFITGFITGDYCIAYFKFLTETTKRKRKSKEKIQDFLKNQTHMQPFKNINSVVLTDLISP